MISKCEVEGCDSYNADQMVGIDTCRDHWDESHDLVVIDVHSCFATVPEHTELYGDWLWFISLDMNQGARQHQHSPHWDLYDFSDGAERFVRAGILDTMAVLKWLAFRRLPLMEE